MPKVVFFNGTLKVKICEASDLRATDFATRHAVGPAKTVQLIDPYISIDVDDLNFAKTTSKVKTCQPVWNEEFTTDVHNGQTLGMTVFHDAAIPPDEFIADCLVPFDALQGASDIWVRFPDAWGKSEKLDVLFGLLKTRLKTHILKETCIEFTFDIGLGLYVSYV